jgi:hypothetical protein
LPDLDRGKQGVGARLFPAFRDRDEAWWDSHIALEFVRHDPGLDFAVEGPTGIRKLAAVLQVVRKAIAFGHVEAMRRALILDQLRLMDTMRRGPARRIDGYRLVSRAVNDERRHAEGGKIRPEVGVAERRRASERGLQCRHHRNARGPIEHVVAFVEGGLARRVQDIVAGEGGQPSSFMVVHVGHVRLFVHLAIAFWRTRASPSAV